MTNDLNRLSVSAAKAFYKSPSHFLRYKRREDAPTEAMKFGSMLHKYILEPQEFEKEYYILNEEQIMLKLSDNKSPRATKIYKEWYAEQEHAAKDKHLVNASEFKRVQRISEAVNNDPHAAELLQGSRKEVKMEKEIHGVPFLGYADIVTEWAVVDLKMAQSAHPDDFQRQAYNLMYHLQAAVYCEMFGVDQFAFIAVEPDGDHIVQVYWCDMEFIGLGQKLLKEICEKFKRWDGTPEGYSRKPLTLTPPRWAK